MVCDLKWVCCKEKKNIFVGVVYVNVMFNNMMIIIVDV